MSQLCAPAVKSSRLKSSARQPLRYFGSKLDLDVYIIKINREKQCFYSINFTYFLMPLNIEFHAFSCHFRPEFSQNTFNDFSCFLMTRGNPGISVSMFVYIPGSLVQGVFGCVEGEGGCLMCLCACV